MGTNDDAFEADNRARIARMGQDAALADQSRAWFDAVTRHGYSYHFRWLGLPARYVTGYLVGEAEAGHAWLEAHVDGLGWVGFDPANRVCPTDSYVRVACGLDAATASPVRGARRGGGKEELEVAVEVMKQQAGQQQSQSQSSGQSQSKTEAKTS